jgi:hypothetical protein
MSVAEPGVLMAYCMACKVAYAVEDGALKHRCGEVDVVWHPVDTVVEFLQKRERSRGLHPSQLRVIEGGNEPGNELLPPPELRIVE